ncbi:hypothetical protein GCK72_011519 [Caenorhabditis remanei]|uniref:Uncharacterized protein n=1 Tax=Caenorhabditis remanei TaxID=31234 RepID=A0A6A5HA03_CAERE|nr:hypothetical protein GCK72_011519 [Caenorhabditis remanei]KAF1763253.1 hypothetical protein GCK72_011519 [Caenorhabditis remanei]
MRFLDALVAVGLLITICQSLKHTTLKFSIAIYCPSGELGEWTASLSVHVRGQTEIYAASGGTTSGKFQVIEIEGFSNNFKDSVPMGIVITSSCKTKSILTGQDIGFPIQDDKGFHYGFRVYNMGDEEDKTNSETYEYLFMKYLEKDCALNACKESTREYVAKGCDFFKKESEQCMKAYDDTLPKFCQKEGSSAHSICSEYATSSTASQSSKMIIIISGAVGAIIVLVLAIGVFFYCRKKKKSKQNLTGTGTMSGSTAASGTTGAPSKSTTGAATTTGTQRY